MLSFQSLFDQLTKNKDQVTSDQKVLFNIVKSDMKSFDEFVNWTSLKKEILNQIEGKIINVEHEIVIMINQFFENEDHNYFNNVNISLLSGYME